MPHEGGDAGPGSRMAEPGEIPPGPAEGVKAPAAVLGILTVTADLTVTSAPDLEENGDA